MRCKCCDFCPTTVDDAPFTSEKVQQLHYDEEDDEYYCSACWLSIRQTIAEDEFFSLAPEQDDEP